MLSRLVLAGGATDRCLVRRAVSSCATSRAWGGCSSSSTPPCSRCSCGSSGWCCRRSCATPACRRARRWLSALVVALIAAAIYTWLPMLVPDAKRVHANLPEKAYPLIGAVHRLSYPALGSGSCDAQRPCAARAKAREPEFPRPLPRVAVALPIPASLRSAPCCIRTQNMPKTTAVRKAKDMMAASTLSLVRSSIAASFAGQTRR